MPELIFPYFTLLYIYIRISGIKQEPVSTPRPRPKSLAHTPLPFYPLDHRSQAVRTIFFNTQNNLVQNAGVMIGWISLSCGTTLIFTWWMRRREIRELQVDESTSVPERLSRELQQYQQQQEQHQQQPEDEVDREKAVEVEVEVRPELPQGSMTEVK